MPSVLSVHAYFRNLDSTAMAAQGRALASGVVAHPNASGKVRAVMHTFLGDGDRESGDYKSALSHYREARRLDRTCDVDSRIEEVLKILGPQPEQLKPRRRTRGR